MNDGSSKIKAWKPGVSRSVLLRTAGAAWIGVAIFLDGLSCSWLMAERPEHALTAAFLGVALAVLIHRFGFLRVADKNVARILPMEGQRCAFAFMSWKSYLLVFVMIAMGYFLRRSSLPKLYLSVLYTAIGTALFLSSMHYLRSSRQAR